MKEILLTVVVIVALVIGAGEIGRSGILDTQPPAPAPVQQTARFVGTDDIIQLPNGALSKISVFSDTVTGDCYIGNYNGFLLAVSRETCIHTLPR